MKKVEAAKELLKRRRAREELYLFIQYINPNYIKSDFARDVCAALDQFLVDMMAEKLPVLILNAPPQHGKSDIVSRYLPAFFFGKFPNKKLGGLSYAKDIAMGMNRDVQKIMLSSAYKRLFPGTKLSEVGERGDGVESRRNNSTFDIVGHDGYYLGQGIGGPLTSKTLDLGIIDDPIKNHKEASSPTIKEAVWNWYVSTFLSRLSKVGGQIIMATRWALDDLPGLILKNAEESGDGGVKHLTFPAISDAGAVLVPDLHPLKQLNKIKKAIGTFFWQAMYQQKPFIQGGGIFKLEWWKYYRLQPKTTNIIQSWDTGFKTGVNNAYSACETWAIMPDGFYLIDVWRGKLEYPELKRMVTAQYEKHRPRSVLIEDKASGQSLVQELRRGSRIPLKAVSVTDGDKVVRAQLVSPLIEAGRVHIPEKAPWLADWLDEHTLFPNSVFKDQVDTTTQALDFMSGTAGRVIGGAKLLGG